MVEGSVVSLKLCRSRLVRVVCFCDSAVVVAVMSLVCASLSVIGKDLVRVVFKSSFRLDLSPDGASSKRGLSFHRQKLVQIFTKIWQMIHSIAQLIRF